MISALKLATQLIAFGAGGEFLELKVRQIIFNCPSVI
jgi:hypothetical protein